MNLPNKLTLSRFVLTGAFLGVIFSGVRFHQTIALVLFSAASLTDYFDGKIARQRKLITNFGILMDPLADKILICSAFIAFVGLNQMRAWMVVLAAEGYGKHKTISQIVAIISILVLASYGDWGAFGKMIFGFNLFGGPWVVWFTALSKWVAVFLTMLSGCLYLWRNRRLYLDDL